MATHGTVAIDGASLAYDVSGSGPPVVLIGGGGTLDRRAWDSLVTALSPRYTVVRYDVRGIGGSSQPSAPFSHSNDLHALLQALKLAPAHVVGLSLGAAIAVDLALDHPESIAALVLAAPGLSNQKDENIQAALAAADAARTHGLSVVVDAVAANPVLLAAADQDVRSQVKAIYLDNSRVFDSDFAFVTFWLPTTPPAEQRLASIRVATLVVIGDRDDQKIRETADTLAARIPGAEKAVLKSAGHLLNLDVPEPFNRAVLGFLARICP